jgi:mannose-6-phosphate isomerase-like protein (cupin superfamily)
LKTPSLEQLERCVVRAEQMAPNPQSPLAAEGVEEAGVIVPQETPDHFPAGPIAGWWPHDFNLRRLTLQTGAYVPLHARKEVEVLFVQSGTVEIGWKNGDSEESLLMGAGDTLSMPVGVQHSFRNTSSAPAVVFVVRGTEQPQMPVFASAPVEELAGAGA